MRVLLPVAALLLLLAPAPPAHAATEWSDSAALAQLESRAAQANPREQCFLYTELVQGYTDLAGKQMAAGDMDQASATLKRVELFAERIHINLARDTKRLKDAEMRMHTATNHLGQYAHFLSTEDKAIVNSTLRQLDKVNSELLAQVFAH